MAIGFKAYKNHTFNIKISNYLNLSLTTKSLLPAVYI